MITEKFNLSALGQIKNQILFNSLDVKMVMEYCQDLRTMIGGMIGEMKKDLPTRII